MRNKPTVRTINMSDYRMRVWIHICPRNL